MKIYLILSLLFFSLATNLNAKKITIDFLQAQPKSKARDFYIWRYLGQKNVSAKNAKKAYELAKYKSYKILKRYMKLTKDKVFLKKQACYGLQPGLFLKEDDKCIYYGLSPAKALKVSKRNKNELKSISKRLAKKYPKTARFAEVFSSKYQVREILKSSPKVFLDIFTRIGYNYRVAHLNLSYKKAFLDKLSKERKFTKFVKQITLNKAFVKTQKSLFNIDSKLASHKANFFLAMNAVKYDKTQEALRYLNFAQKSVKSRMDLDKVLFWKYLLTKKFKYLNQIASKSYNVNMYSILAFEKLNLKIPNIVTEVATNMKYNKKFPESDPFHWLNYINSFNKKKDFKKAIKELNYQNTESHLTYILNKKKSSLKTNYFIIPYRKYLKIYEKDRQAMILSLARQESNFIPTAVSTSYALGLMQIMPFLATHISKTLREKTTLDDMLKPDVSIRYANYHLNHDLKRLHHPLLIAYAYNGGIGFTKKMLKNGLFNKHKKYEPFYSMETVTYDESRGYGKKVLANYVIYKQLLGEKVKISKMLNDLKFKKFKDLYYK